MKAKITLTGPKTYAMGRYVFKRGIPVWTDVDTVIKRCKIMPEFAVEIVDSESENDTPKKAKGRKKGTTNEASLVSWTDSYMR